MEAASVEPKAAIPASTDHASAGGCSMADWMMAGRFAMVSYCALDFVVFFSVDVDEAVCTRDKDIDICWRQSQTLASLAREKNTRRSLSDGMCNVTANIHVIEEFEVCCLPRSWCITY